MTNRTGVAPALSVPLVALYDSAAVLLSSTLADNSYEGATISDWDNGTTYAAGARVVVAYYPVYQRNATSSGGVNNQPPTNATYWNRVSTYYWDGYSSGVTGITAAAYNSGTAYTTGQYVFHAASGGQVRYKVYESLQSGNTGHDPRSEGATPTWWVEVGPTNRWAMFDTSVRTKSLGNFTVSLKIGTADTIALVGIEGGTSISLHHKTSAGATIQNYGSFSLTDKPNFVKTGLTPTANSTVEIVFAGTSVGTVAAGTYAGLGTPAAGVRKSRKTYGRPSYDPDFGTFDYSEQFQVPTLDITTTIQEADINRIDTFLDSLAGDAAIWIGNTDLGYEYAVLFGVYDGYEIVTTAANQQARLGLKLVGVN